MDADFPAAGEACKPAGDAVLIGVPTMVQNSVNMADPLYATYGFRRPYVTGILDDPPLPFNILIYDSGSNTAHPGCFKLNAPSFCPRTSMETPQHELFHNVQRAYKCDVDVDVSDCDSGGISATWGEWVAEGTARMMQDKLTLAFDTGNTSFRREVRSTNADSCSDGTCPPRGPINFPGTSLTDRSYAACLFWSYCCEQFGDRTDLITWPEPAAGVDFMVSFWEQIAVDKEEGTIDALASLGQTIRGDTTGLSSPLAPA